jgi:hypothetical protein
MIELGVKINDKHASWLEAIGELSECGWWFPSNGAVVMTSRPIGILHQDAQGRLHNANGPAIQWNDGYSLYAFHGVRVGKDIIENPELITTDQIMKETNSEVRRVMCERMGWEKFITEAGLTMIDECDDPANMPNKLRLYETPEQVLGVPVRLLSVVNATPKLNGEIPRYAITVPAEIDSALAGAAWSFDVDVKMYKSMARAT